MSKMDEISDKNNDTHDCKIEVANDIDKIHISEHILSIKITPNEKYLIICGSDGSIVYWDVEKVDKKGRLESKFEIYSTILNDKILHGGIFSDNIKAVTFGHESRLRAYDINNDLQINLDLDYSDSNECAFNLNNDLISYYKGSRDNKGIVFIYSTQTRDNKWNCKRIFKVPEYLKVHKDFRIISVSKYDKLYFMLSKKFIYEFDLITEKSKEIWVIDENIRSTEYFSVNIVDNESLVCLKVCDKIIIYSVKLEIPIVSLDIKKNVNQLCMLMRREHPVSCSRLFPLLLSLFSYKSSNKFWNSIMKDFWIKCIDQVNLNLNPDVQLPKEYKLIDIQATNKYVFVILDVGIWRIDLEKMISSINSLFTDEIVDNFHILLYNSHMDTIRELFHEVILKLEPFDYISLPQNSQNSLKWKFSSNKDYKKIGLRLSDDNDIWSKGFFRIGIERYEEFKLDEDPKFLGIKLLNEKHIIILTQIGLLIYHYNKVDKSISLNYYHYMKLSEIAQLRSYEKEFLDHPDLPSPNRTSFENCDKWVSAVIDNNDKERFLKCGVGLLTFAIEEHNVKLIDDIYNKCIEYFKEDFSNKILSIITSTMPLLNKYYPEYVERYSLETTMIIDSSSCSLVYLNDDLHLSSFEYPQLDNLSRSLSYHKYQLLINNLKKSHKKMANILNFIQYLIIFLILPIYFATFYILSKFNFFNNIITNSTLYFKYKKERKIPTLVFLNPYIKFINYPTKSTKYYWVSELFWPEPSPFVETINKDIYKTWNGESLINFKWDTYGKYYYAIIWILFMTYLGCFTVAATIPLEKDVQTRLLIASIILGLIHLSFEIRQIIYDFNKWIRDFWNIFDVIAYVLPIITSIIWLRASDMNTISLLSFSCLFLDIKFLLFFRALEHFGVYFAIIISVGKRIISFLVVLFIIIISFAHAFYILLLPRSPFSLDERTDNNDPNNPWNLASAYYQVFENGSIGPNPYIIQPPSESTNMFVNFRTAIFGTYQFLTGDSSAFSNWSYTADPSLAILFVLFSLLIVVYLMNLLIGLLSNAIEENNNRVSFLIQKAEILAEIELFYLLPFQRRWDKWFPEVIYYYANADKTREKIKGLIKDKEWESNEHSKLKESLLKELRIENVTNKSEN